MDWDKACTIFFGLPILVFAGLGTVVGFIVIFGGLGGIIYNTLRIAYIGKKKNCQIISCVLVPRNVTVTGDGGVYIIPDSYNLTFDCTELPHTVYNNDICKNRDVTLLISDRLKGLQILNHQNLIVNAFKHMGVVAIYFLLIVAILVKSVIHLFYKEWKKEKLFVKFQISSFKDINLLNLSEILVLTATSATALTVYILIAMLILSFMFSIESQYYIVNGIFFLISLSLAVLAPYLALKTYNLIKRRGKTFLIIKNFLISIIALKTISTTLLTLKDVITIRPKIETFRDIFVLITDNI